MKNYLTLPKRLILALNKKKYYFSIKYFYLILIILISVKTTYASGYKGIFPIDSFLIFDGGYKIINGFYPFKDYWSITGPILDYFQSIIFYIFGINWATYIFHAALVNTILSLTSYYFFCQLGVKKILSFAYAISTAILAYPSVGSPFMDHHATIFSLMALMFMILAIKKHLYAYWFLIPVLLGISFFSKQIPSAYLTILFVFTILIYFYLNKFKKKKEIFYFLGGFLFFVFFIVSIALINKIPFNNFITQYIMYPLNLGQERTSSLVLDFQNTFLQFKYIYIAILPAIISAVFISKKNNKEKKNDFIIIILSVISIIIFLYCQLITKNQVLIFFLIPFCLGLSNFYLMNYIKKEIFNYLLIFLLITLTTKYHLRFNVDKKFMDFSNIDFSVSQNANSLDSNLNNLKWITSRYNLSPKLELDLLREAKAEIISFDANKIIISDYQIMPFITETSQFAPNKWFDELSVPETNNQYFKIYKEFFNSSLKKQNIKKIFIIGKEKEKYLKNVLNQSNCIKKKELNAITISYDLKNC